MSNTCYSCQILMKLEFYRQIFEKYSNIKFRENTSSGSRTVPRGGTDRHDEAKTCFRNFANAPKMASLFSTVFTPGSQGRSHMQATGSSTRPSSDYESKCRYSNNLLNPKRWNCLNLYPKRNFPQRTIPQICLINIMQ
jgi:hypothetical protein